MNVSNNNTCPIAKISATEYNKEVYEPSDDTFALVDAFVQDSETWNAREPHICVEIGSGSGYVLTSSGLALQSKHRSCLLLGVDVTVAAAAATKRTLAAHGVEADIVRCDLLGAFSPRLHKQIDLILFNPPYVVTSNEEVSVDGISAAWAGGQDGRVVIDRLLSALDTFLSPSGLLYMIAIQDNKPKQLIEELRSKHGLQASILLSRRADEELIHVLRVHR